MVLLDIILTHTHCIIAYHLFQCRSNLMDSNGSKKGGGLKHSGLVGSEKSSSWWFKAFPKICSACPF